MLVVSTFALLIAGAAAALSLAVALRVKKVLDPLVEQGMLKRPPSAGLGMRVPATSGLIDRGGEVLDLDAPRAESWFLVFVSRGCPRCAAQLPDFERLLSQHRVAAERVVSVVLGSGDDAEAYQKEVSRFSRVVGDQRAAAEIMSALGVQAFPTFMHVGADATVTFSSASVSLFKDSIGRALAPAAK